MTLLLSFDIYAISICLVNGIWSLWGVFSSCSTTCGNGYELRKRSCTNPPPRYDGDLCSGESFDIRECINNPCPGNFMDLCYNIKVHFCRVVSIVS